MARAVLCRIVITIEAHTSAVGEVLREDEWIGQLWQKHKYIYLYMCIYVDIYTCTHMNFNIIE